MLTFIYQHPSKAFCKVVRQIHCAGEKEPTCEIIIDTIVNKIKNRGRADGYHNYYSEESFKLNKGAHSERKNYDRVFWTNINTKLLHLYPTEEKYASEIEKSIYNVLMAAQDTNVNIGVYNHLHGKKEINSQFAGYCCKAASVSMMNSKLPEFIYGGCCINSNYIPLQKGILAATDPDTQQLGKFNSFFILTFFKSKIYYLNMNWY